MAGGGAERVMAVLVNELARRGHDVTLAIFSEAQPYYKIDNKVKIKHFSVKKGNNVLGKINSRLGLYSSIRKLSKREKPDAIISFIYQTNTRVLLNTLFLGIPVIVSEHNTLNQKKPILDRIQRFQISKLADKLTILTEYDYRFIHPKLKNKVVMPNPLSITAINEYNINREKVILAVGNTHKYKQKGLDNLIEIWSSIADKYPEWKLRIAGSYNTDSISYLKSIEQKQNTKNKIQYLGQVKDMKSLYRDSSIFILPSRWEGFPMALLEAMSQGCTCISYDLVTGPNEIITDGFDGILVKDQNIEEMTSKLIMLIEKSDKREKLAKEAIKSINQFSMEKIVDRWESLLSDVIKK